MFDPVRSYYLVCLSYLGILMLSSPSFANTDSLEGRFADHDQPNDVLHPCCHATPTGIARPGDAKLKVNKFSLNADPYLAGFPRVLYNGLTQEKNLNILPATEGMILIPEKDFNYHPPTTVGQEGQLGSFHFSLPPLQHEFDAKYIQNQLGSFFRLSPQFKYDESFKLIGEGVYSHVFYVRSQSPLAEPWAGNVIKVRNPSPSHSPRPGKALNQARRDLVMGDAINQLAEHFFELNERGEKERVIFAESYDKTPLEAKIHGIFLQTAHLQGVTGAELARTILSVKYGHDRHAKNKLIDLGFKDSEGNVDLKAAIKKLALFEKFYELVQLDLAHFQEDNQLPLTLCPVRISSASDSSTKMICAIDFQDGNAIYEKGRWFLIDY